jgi:hypothetical protein
MEYLLFAVNDANVLARSVLVLHARKVKKMIP